MTWTPQSCEESVLYSSSNRLIRLSYNFQFESVVFVELIRFGDLCMTEEEDVRCLLEERAVSFSEGGGGVWG